MCVDIGTDDVSTVPERKRGHYFTAEVPINALSPREHAILVLLYRKIQIYMYNIVMVLIPVKFKAVV